MEHGDRALDFADLALRVRAEIDPAAYALEHDFPRDEYELRRARARTLMAQHGLDALAITSSGVGYWFTGRPEPHSWHDRVAARSAWFVLTADRDVLLCAPTNNQHLDAVRRSVWVTDVLPLVERAAWPRREMWGLEQIPYRLRQIGIESGRLGFELGDCMTLGISFNDFERLRELLPRAALVDASAVIRQLMSVHTPLEIERLRAACAAGVWVHEQIGVVLRPGMTERELIEALAQAFSASFPSNDGYVYARAGGWDVRNADRRDSNRYHTQITERRYRLNDVICRGNSGASYRGYDADVDRVWHVGAAPSTECHDWYRVAHEANREMAARIRPGARCSDVYAAYEQVLARHGFPAAVAGRVGHGIRNTGGLSVHPDNRTVLEPDMVISVEPMIGDAHGYFDQEDQYLVTQTGAECLHQPSPAELPCVPW
ncbi:MAG: Xaa-Pro peptidase family protein [Chloroflexota bacterium]